MLVRTLVTLAAFGSIVDAFAPRSGTIVHRRIASGVSSSNEVMVIMNGLSGAMGNEVASACLRRGMRLAPVALSGPSSGGTTVEVGGVKFSRALLIIRYNGNAGACGNMPSHHLAGQVGGQARIRLGTTLNGL